VLKLVADSQSATVHTQCATQMQSQVRDRMNETVKLCCSSKAESAASCQAEEHGADNSFAGA
jgi:hypothetical protein